MRRAPAHARLKEKVHRAQTGWDELAQLGTSRRALFVEFYTHNTQPRLVTFDSPSPLMRVRLIWTLVSERAVALHETKGESESATCTRGGRPVDG